MPVYLMVYFIKIKFLMVKHSSMIFKNYDYKI